MGKISTVIVSAALAVGALFGYVAVATTSTTAHLSRAGVYCPEEDGCDVDYNGVLNRMIIIPVTR